MHDEAVLAAGFFQKLEEEVAASSSTEVRLTAIAAAGNEMQIPCAVVAVESPSSPDHSTRRGWNLAVIPGHSGGDEAHSFAKDANEWGTRLLVNPLA